MGSSKGNVLTNSMTLKSDLAKSNKLQTREYHFIRAEYLLEWRQEGEGTVGHSL